MYQIKPATTADVEAIRRIADETWWPTYGPILSSEQIIFMLNLLYSEEKITAQISSGDQRFLMLLEDDEAAGFAAYSPREEDPEIYKLHKLYCLPKTQGRGYGKILIDEVIRKTAEDGKHTLDLNVNRNNKARGFYEKMGFEVIYEEDIAIGPYWMNDFVMRKSW